MVKSRDAFRTISEVADWLDTPAHVLRFWESKFTQIKPVKRAGGRRYYRPEDMALLGGIKSLLHDQGMTIKGAQKLLRDMGVKHVSGLGPQPLDFDAEAGPDIDMLSATTTPNLKLVPSEPRSAAPVAMPPPRSPPDPEPAPVPEPAPPAVQAPAIDDSWPFTPEQGTKAQGDAWPPDPTPEPVVKATPLPPRDPAPQQPEPVLTGGTLSQLLRADRRHLVARATRIAPLARKLTALRDQMARSQG